MHGPLAARLLSASGAGPANSIVTAALPCVSTAVPAYNTASLVSWLLGERLRQVCTSTGTNKFGTPQQVWVLILTSPVAWHIVIG